MQREHVRSTSKFLRECEDGSAKESALKEFLKTGNPRSDLFVLDVSSCKEQWVDIDGVLDKPVCGSVKSEVQEHLESIFDRYTQQVAVFRRVLQYRGTNVKEEMLQRENDIADTVVAETTITSNLFRATNTISRQARATKIKGLEVSFD